MPGTAVAVRPLALRLTQRRRVSELWRQGRAERRLGGSSNTAPYAVLRWRCTHALRLDSHAATLTKRCGRWCYGPKTWRTPRGWEHRHRLAADTACSSKGSKGQSLIIYTPANRAAKLELGSCCVSPELLGEIAGRGAVAGPPTGTHGSLPCSRE